MPPTPIGMGGLLWPLAFYFAAVVFLVAIMMLVSSLLGPRHAQKATCEPFESGIVTVGCARFRFPA